MPAEQTRLKIKAENLGSVTEIREFLIDLEFAYNSIYIFDFIVKNVSFTYERSQKAMEDRFRLLRQYAKDISIHRNYPFDPFFYEFFREDYFDGRNTTLPTLIELQATIKSDNIVLPDERLVISKINIQSPGFWEFVGSLNPLAQIREYLKDRHERKKDKNYRNRIEETMGELEILEKQNNIIKQRIDFLKSAGYTDTEIRPLLVSLIINPLHGLDKHQDKGLIEGPEE